MSIRLIVGLGNPGPEYEQTRHNAGFWLVDNLAIGPLQRESRFNALMAKTSIAGKEVWLLEPLTFMNRSGQSIHVNDLTLPEGVTALTHGQNLTIATSSIPRGAAAAAEGEAQ